MYQIDIKKGAFRISRRKILYLKENGFYFRPENHCWTKKTENIQEVSKWKRFCFIRFSFRSYDINLHTRSNNYRKLFFEKNKPLLWNRYQCVYCGRLYAKRRITVDHLIPIDQVKASKFWQKVISLLGYSSINDPKNLVPACEHCNKSKGSKTGIWIIRGLIGRFFPFWIIFYGSILFAFIYLIVYFSNLFS